ncbi:hypothetical protein ACVSTU_21050 [Yersinia enterocolitica]|uniref:hypothetical protein n=1 Tax=Yersinia enterocolitica TaxID=630 RepID=UPI0037D64AA8
MANTINIERLKNIILKNSATHAEFMTITSMLLAYMVPNDTPPNNTHNKPNHNDCRPHIGSYSYNLVGQHCHGSSLYKNGTLTHEGTNSHDHSDSLIKLFSTQYNTNITDTELCSLMRQVAKELVPETLSPSHSDTNCSLVLTGLLKLACGLLNIAADRIK